jgi:polyisoprenoid-binding protein YceI
LDCADGGFAVLKYVFSAALVSVLQSSVASAHHAFAADYSADLTGTIEGEVVEVFYQNPHAHYYVEVTAEDGSKQVWDAQTMNLMALSRLGWLKDTVQVGDKLQINGNLGRNETKRINILTLEQEDGTVWRPMGRGNSGDQPGGLTAIPPGTYAPDPNHAYLSFSYSHLGLSHPQLRFASLDAMLDLDTSDMRNSRVDVSIDAASLDTAVPQLDEDLRGEAFFDIANYPEITFTSTAYEPLRPDAGKLTGNLTVKGVTRPVTLNVQINEAADNPMSRDPTIGISATGTLSRSDFGLAAMVPMIGDEVSVEIQMELVKTDER